MINYNSKEADIIVETTHQLSILYPIEANYGSRCSLWSRALDDGDISREEYDQAREYYGRIWTYVGD